MSPVTDDPLRAAEFLRSGSLGGPPLRGGGVVAFPTETVYGLAADALDAEAVARVYALKQRPSTNPLIVHVADAAMAATLVEGWPPVAEALAAAFWPGPLTLVLRAAPHVPRIVTAGLDTVAVRCPDHPLTLSLIQAFGGPIVGPSANPSGRLSPTTANHVLDAFAREVERGELLVLDGGPCACGIESTVLSLAESPPRILRPGPVTEDDIVRAVPELGLRPAAAGAPIGAGDSPAPSPGMFGAHYQPRTRVRLFDPAEWPTILESADEAVVLAHTDLALPPGFTAHRLLLLPKEPAAYATTLYSALHHADSLMPDAILVLRPPPAAAGGLWGAINDRLTRAAAPNPPGT